MSEKLRKIFSASLAALMLVTAAPVLAEDAAAGAESGIVVSTVSEPGTDEPAPDALDEASVSPADMLVTMSRYFVRSGYVRRR